MTFSWVPRKALCYFESVVLSAHKKTMAVSSSKMLYSFDHVVLNGQPNYDQSQWCELSDKVARSGDFSGKLRQKMRSGDIVVFYRLFEFSQ